MALQNDVVVLQAKIATVEALLRSNMSEHTLLCFTVLIGDL